MHITKRSERIESTTYSRHFERVGEPGSGFSFDSDEHGNVDRAALKPTARESYDACVDGTLAVVDRGVQVWRHAYTASAEGACDRCRATVVLSGFTNTCERCGADYNMSGQQLAPREQWGEETGESLGDILRIR